MAGEGRSFAIGLAAYIFGIIASNVIFGSFAQKFSFPLPLEMLIICLGVLSMSLFYYSGFSFALLFVVGVMLGGYVATDPMLPIISIFPVGISHSAGLQIGRIIKDDLAGRTNFWAEKWKIITLIIIVLLFSVGSAYAIELARLKFQAFMLSQGLP